MKNIIKTLAVCVLLCVVATASPSFALVCANGKTVDANEGGECDFVNPNAPSPSAIPRPAAVPPTPPTQQEDPFQKVMMGGERIVKGGTIYSQKMLFGLAGLGATATGAMAFFGRFRWNRFFILVGALLMMASAQYGVDYITNGSKRLQTIENK